MMRTRTRHTRFAPRFSCFISFVVVVLAPASATRGLGWKRIEKSRPPERNLSQGIASSAPDG